MTQTEWVRPESLPNRSNPAPETGQPKITASAGRSQIPRASWEVLPQGKATGKLRASGHPGRSCCFELLLCNPPRCSRNLFHIQQTNSAVTSATAARARPSHTCSTIRQGGQWERDNCHQAELPLPLAHRGWKALSSVMLLATACPWCSHLFLWEVSCIVRHG